MKDFRYARDYRDLITNMIEEEKIFIYVFTHVISIPVPKLGENILSPLRPDTNESFGLYSNGNQLKWKDFGISKQYGNNAVSLMMHYTGDGYRTCLNKIVLDLIVHKIPLDKKLCDTMARVKTRRTTHTGVKFSPKWTEQGYLYWKQQGIPLDVLAKYNVYMLQELWLDYYLWHKATEKDPFFIYLFSKDPQQWQTYRPKARGKGKKFRNKDIGSVIMGWEQLPDKGDVMCITSSYKDVINLSARGLPSVSKSTESSIHLFPFNEMKELKSRFKRIISIQDNDTTGITATKELQKIYPFVEGWHIPEMYLDVTDPSDLISKTEYGEDELRKLLKTKLNIEIQNII